MLAYRLGYIYATFITLNVRLELEIQIWDLFLKSCIDSNEMDVLKKIH